MHPDTAARRAPQITPTYQCRPIHHRALRRRQSPPPYKSRFCRVRSQSGSTITPEVFFFFVFLFGDYRSAGFNGSL